jgi:hypothetical protein
LEGGLELDPFVTNAVAMGSADSTIKTALQKNEERKVRFLYIWIRCIEDSH